MNPTLRAMRTVSIAGTFLLFMFASAGCPFPPGASPPKEPPPTVPPSDQPDFESWSTNFADVSDLSTAGIHPFETGAIIDTSNVNSGGKSIKAYGVVGSPSTCLNINFVLSGLAGCETMDLSDKSVSIEMYVPGDSSIHTLRIVLFSAGRYVVIRSARDYPYRGQWRTYTVDVRQDLTLKPWRASASLTSPGLSDEQAIDVIKHAESIAVIGSIFSEHPLAETYVLIDRIAWAPAGPPPSRDPMADSLQSSAPAALSIGGFMEPDGVAEPDYLKTLIQHFGATLTWNELPIAEPPAEALHYDETWNLTPWADGVGASNGFKLVRYAFGHNPYCIPDWLPPKTYSESQAILENYVRAAVSHCEGNTYVWILFNELLRYHLPADFVGFGLKDRDQTPQTWGGDYSPWSSSPSDLAMIEDAFRVARAADPSALLLVNESYSAVQGHPGAEALYRLVSQMKSDGVPIDGVGFQGHLILDQSGTFYEASPLEPPLRFDPTGGFVDIASNVDRYAALGLTVAFTEVDVAIYCADIDPATTEGRALLAQRRELQASAYRSLMHIALTHANVAAFVLFDWADEYAWTDSQLGQSSIPQGYGNDVGLFDRYYQPKASYEALHAELMAR